MVQPTLSPKPPWRHQWPLLTRLRMVGPTSVDIEVCRQPIIKSCVPRVTPVASSQYQSRSIPKDLCQTPTLSVKIIRFALTIAAKQQQHHSLSVESQAEPRNFVFSTMAANNNNNANNGLLPLLAGTVPSDIPQVALDAPLVVPQGPNFTIAGLNDALRVDNLPYQVGNRPHARQGATTGYMVAPPQVLTQVVYLDRTQIPFNEPGNRPARATWAAVMHPLQIAIDQTRIVQQGQRRGGAYAENPLLDQILADRTDDLAHVIQEETPSAPNNRQAATLRMIFVEFTSTNNCNIHLKAITFIYAKLRVGAPGFRREGNEFQHAVYAVQHFYIASHNDVNSDSSNGLWTSLIVMWLNGHFDHIRARHPLPRIPFGTTVDQNIQYAQPGGPLAAHTQRRRAEDDNQNGYFYSVDSRPDVIQALRRYLWDEHQFNAEHLPQANVPVPAAGDDDDDDDDDSDPDSDDDRDEKGRKRSRTDRRRTSFMKSPGSVSISSH